MRLPPIIHGLIKRRLLINYRVDPGVIRRALPAPFRPKLHEGFAVAGACLIRLEQIRPSGLPLWLGLSSENAAHRVAVEWEGADGRTAEGVFILRRDTSSTLNHLVGGRLFPGEHQIAAFQVYDEKPHIDFSMSSRDGQVALCVHATATSQWNSHSCFKSLDESSAFFQRGMVGYSATRHPLRMDGLRLETDRWQVDPLRIDHLEDSFFRDSDLFPVGSVEFDHALLMRDIPHRWLPEPQLNLEQAVPECLPLGPAAFV